MLIKFLLINFLFFIYILHKNQLINSFIFIHFYSIIFLNLNLSAKFYI